MLSTCYDPYGRPTVIDFLPLELRKGIHPVGRLDLDSRGAILLTNEGSLTLQLTHPRYAHAKSYEVWVKGMPSDDTLEQI